MVTIALHHQGKEGEGTERGGGGGGGRGGGGRTEKRETTRITQINNLCRCKVMSEGDLLTIQQLQEWHACTYQPISTSIPMLNLPTNASTTLLSTTIGPNTLLASHSTSFYRSLSQVSVGERGIYERVER